jgi:hypothetical protein
MPPRRRAMVTLSDLEQTYDGQPIGGGSIVVHTK